MMATAAGTTRTGALLSRASTASMRRWAPPVSAGPSHQPAGLGGGGDAAARRGEAHGGRPGDRQLQRPSLDRRDRRAHHGARHRARPRHRSRGAAQDGRRHPGRRGAAARRWARRLRQARVRPGPRPRGRLRARPHPRPPVAWPRPAERERDRGSAPGRARAGGGRHRSRTVLRHGPRRPRRRRDPDRSTARRAATADGGPLRHPRPGPPVGRRRPEGTRRPRGRPAPRRGADALLEGFRPGRGRAARHRTRRRAWLGTRGSSTGG